MISIQVIQNLHLWSSYQNEIKRMTDLTGQAPLCLRLWHGTRLTPPSTVYQNGLNINYCKDGTYFGRAIYFAVNANYSCPAYSSQVPGSQNEYEVFCANVVIGKSIDVLESEDAKKLVEPPFIEGTSTRYDSVKGNTQNHDVYMVYQNVKAYPGLLVRYSCA